MSDQMQYRMLVRNLRKMTEAGHLIRCSACQKLVLLVNTTNGECNWHKLTLKEV